MSDTPRDRSKTGVSLYFHGDCTGEWRRGMHRFDPEQPRLLRLGILAKSELGHAKTFVSIIRPDPGVAFESTMIGKHRVTRELAERVGVPAGDAIARLGSMLSAFIASSAAINLRVCAYSATWHRDLVLREADAWGIPQSDPIWALDALPLHCVMRAAVPVARIPAANGRGFKWPTLIEAHGAVTGTRLVYDDDAVVACQQLLAAVAAVDAATQACAAESHNQEASQ